MCEMMMQPLMKPFRVAGDMSIAEFNGLLQKAEGRDKLARIFQYSARLLVGSVALLQPTAGEPRSPEVCPTGVLETATTVPTGGSKLEIRLRSLG
ncbi:Hypothetical protein SCF082_LOCUS14823 [Durusdinium trenchii]|uniref:Uncharacterized protein n=1 Tax=Durusdinium trenchii TaxID=1381693 RepID=A0ABP0K0D0_9DINO